MGGGDSSFRMPIIAKYGLKRSQDQQEEFELYEGSARFKCVQSVNLVDKFIESRMQQQSETGRYSKGSPPPTIGGINLNSNKNIGGRSSNFHSNDTNMLAQKLKELEAELGSLDSEYEQLQSENDNLKEENENIKQKNKQLFGQITSCNDLNELQQTGGSSNNNLQQTNAKNENNNNNIGDIHSLYQDLFLTDIKKEVETAQTELKNCKQEQNNVQREIVQLKKDNQSLNATLKRYRKTLQDLTKNKKEDLNLNFMSPTDLHKMHMMSFESMDPSAQIPSSMLQRNQQDTQKGGKTFKRSDSGTSSASNLISQATFIETAKIERLLAALVSIQQADKIYEILMTGLKEIKVLVNCQNCTIFVLNSELQRNLVGIEKTQNINMQKFTLDGGKYIDALCENDRELSQPGFKKPEDIKYGMKTQQFLAQPVLFKDEEIILVIQCEAKINKKTNKFIGFQVADEQVLKIFSYYLQMRFERRVALREVKQREQAVVDTLKLTSEICTQRHHEGLFRKMKENLPEFFGFEAVGVLIYNYKSNTQSYVYLNLANWLFSDPDHIKKEEVKKEEATIESMPGGTIEDQKPEMTQHETTTVEEQEEQQPDALSKIKEIHQKKFMNFPCNSGISGIVFQSSHIFISNNATKETKFIDEIDNQSNCTDVKNFMIGPVYGERKDVPCGIIQFINKEKGQQITLADENKFKAMQGLLGMCIDNTNEMSLTINVTLDVHDVMQKIGDIMKKEEEAFAGDSGDQMDNLQEHIKTIKENYTKLMDDRNKGKTQL